MASRARLILAFLPVCLGLSVSPMLGEAQGQAVLHQSPIPVPVVLGVMSRCVAVVLEYLSPEGA
jgi:hypothetical protein